MTPKVKKTHNPTSPLYNLPIYIKYKYKYIKVNKYNENLSRSKLPCRSPEWHGSLDQSCSKKVVAHNGKGISPSFLTHGPKRVAGTKFVYNLS